MDSEVVAREAARVVRAMIRAGHLGSEEDVLKAIEKVKAALLA